MEAISASGSALGVGVSSSDSEIQIAFSQGPEHIQLISKIGFPASYVQTNSLPRPMGFMDWLSDFNLSITHRDGRVENRKTTDILKIMLEAGLMAAEAVLGRRIDFLSFGVAPSLSERKRARLRALFQELSVKAQLVNEGRAALKYCCKSNRASDVLLYNLRLNSVTSSIYRVTGPHLSADRLEISESSGWNYLIFALIRALLDDDPAQNINLATYHDTFTRLQQAIIDWRPDDPLEVSINQEPDGTRMAIPAGVVKRIIRDTFDPSFTAARQLMADQRNRPEVMTLSLFPFLSFIKTSLQQALGSEAKHIDRDSIWKGLAISAWESKGRPDLEIALSAALPQIIEPFDSAFSDPASSSRASADRAKAKIAAGPKKPAEPEVQSRFKHTLDKFIQLCGKLTAEEIKALTPGMQTATEEFLARIQDQRAKKHIDRHEFDKAYNIYRKYYQKRSGYQILSAPAIGLCLNRTRETVRDMRLKEAKNWIQKGLYFNRHHQELLGYKKHLKTMAKKK